VKHLLFVPMILSSVGVTYFFVGYRSHSDVTAFDFGLKPDATSVLTTDFGFHPSWHPERSKRFPSTKERIKILMSNWYQPPCVSDQKNELFEFKYLGYDSLTPELELVSLMSEEEGSSNGIISAKMELQDRPTFLHPLTLKPPNCVVPECQLGLTLLNYVHNQCNENIIKWKGMLKPIVIFYCHDASTIINNDRFDVEYPIIASRRPISHDKKSISKATKKIDCHNYMSRPYLATISDAKRYMPIVYDVYDIQKQMDLVLQYDRSWRTKVNMVVWRGNLSGHMIQTASASFDEKCTSNVRCQLVRKFANSMTIDAGVSNQIQELQLENDYLSLIKGPMTIEEELQYKAILVIDGDDFETRLAWALYSGSVVLMPKPTVTTYIMEELLKPWVHYIPVKEDLHDLEKRLEWIGRNDQLSKKIAERGTLYMHDLMSVDDEVKTTILERYFSFFIGSGV
jgi:hypothetical protein